MIICINNKCYTPEDVTRDNIMALEDLIKDLPMSEIIELQNKLLGYSKFSVNKDVLLKKIDLIDSSDEVNSFIYDSRSYWFSKEVRASLLNLANFSDDNEELDLILGDSEVKIKAIDLKKFLAKLELYASKCFAVTCNKKRQVEAFTDKEELINFDCLQGYPEKITL